MFNITSIKNFSNYSDIVNNFSAIYVCAQYA